ncbi:MAG: hypothetical protein JWM10_4141, partial [Myxococcaceae bacterium]|nr:hypothetical protein [Myxococcaceae bacterium]
SAGAGASTAASMAGGPASTGAGAPYMGAMAPGSCGPWMGATGSVTATGAGAGSVVAAGVVCGAGSWVEAQPSARVVAKVKTAARLRVVVDAGTIDAGAMAIAAAQKGQRAASLRTWRMHDGHGARGELMGRDATAGGRRVSSEEAHTFSRVTFPSRPCGRTSSTTTRIENTIAGANELDR